MKHGKWHNMYLTHYLLLSYQDFLDELIRKRVLSSYKWAREAAEVEEIVTMFLPATALLLDFACFPIFCNMDNETLKQPLLLTDSTINGKIGRMTII